MQRISGRLVATFAVAAGAGTTFVAAQASAADYLPVQPQPVANQWRYSLEGGPVFSNFTNNIFSEFDPFTKDKLGLPETDMGYYGAVSVGRDIKPGIDWRVGFGMTGIPDHTHNSTQSIATPGDPILLFDQRNTGLEFQTLDFDLGKRWDTPTSSVRLFAGLRGLHARDHVNANFTAIDKVGGPPFETITGDKMGRTETWGIGPRAGIDFEYGGALGIAGSVSGSFLWAHRDINSQGFLTSNIPGPGSGSFNLDGSENETIANATATLGVQWKPTQKTALLLGYRVDYWHNLQWDYDFQGSRDTLVHGPVFKLSVHD